MSDLTYAGKIGICTVFVKKNKLTDFIASVSEAVRGLFLPPPKLRPQKNVTMFTNRKRVYKPASTKLLCSLDTLYYGALRFILNCNVSTHLCDLYNRVGWLSLSTRRRKHWYLFIYKSILGLLPSYL